MLQYLVERPGALVEKGELLDAVWGDVVVTADVVRVSVGELRRALGDDRAAPRFIETAPRRGYRFVADVQPATEAASGGRTFVGRERERGEIAEWFADAMHGRRTIGFIHGEAGIGKTALVAAALEDVGARAGSRVRVARGQCVELYGHGAPYFPVLEAITSLCQTGSTAAVQAAIREHAPDWLTAELIGGGADEPRTAPGSSISVDQTLRRLAATIEAIATDAPLVLTLEDVQWCDPSTLDLLSVIAQGRAPSRLLVLCTIRSAEAIAERHPVASVRRELSRRHLCREVELRGLSHRELGRVLETRFEDALLDDDRRQALVDRSGGNPFFLVALAEHAVDTSGDAPPADIPEGVRAAIEPRLDRLDPHEARVLEAASVVGPEFAVALVASAMKPGSPLADVETVDRICDGLARRQDILSGAPEQSIRLGQAGPTYVFRHALYREVVQSRLSASSRRRLHRAVGEALEASHPGREATIATELAEHFERGGDVDRAIHYLGEAASLARSRSAYAEAIRHLEAAIALAGSRPESTDLRRHELRLLYDLGSARFALQGYGEERGTQILRRMKEQAERLGDRPMQARAMDGLLSAHMMRAENSAALTLAKQLIAMAESEGNTIRVANTQMILGATRFGLGELEAARDLGEVVSSALRSDAGLPPVFELSSSCLLASVYAHLGRIGEARGMVRTAVASTERLGTPYFQAHAISHCAQVEGLLGNVEAAETLADEARTLAVEYGFEGFRLWSEMIKGWCDVHRRLREEGLASLQAAFDDYEERGQRVSTTYFSMLLAEARLEVGDVARATEVVERAIVFASRTGERLYEPELHRLRGRCALQNARPREADAKAHFECAMRMAAERGGVLFELRAATDLFRLAESTRPRLAALADRFGPEDDCSDVRIARALL